MITRIEHTDLFLARCGFMPNHRNQLVWLALSVNEYADTSDFGARWNLWDSTLRVLGSTDYNDNGGFPVQNYPTQLDGINATKNTLFNGRYVNAVNALRSVPGTNPVSEAKTILMYLMAGGWGSINLSLPQLVEDEWTKYTVLVVSGGEDVSPPPPPKPPTEVDVDIFITANPHGAGDFLCSWSARSAVGIPSTAVEAELSGGGKIIRNNLSVAAFQYFIGHLSNWS